MLDKGFRVLGEPVLRNHKFNHKCQVYRTWRGSLTCKQRLFKRENVGPQKTITLCLEFNGAAQPEYRRTVTAGL